MLWYFILSVWSVSLTVEYWDLDRSFCFSHALYIDFQYVALSCKTEKVSIAGNMSSMR